VRIEESFAMPATPPPTSISGSGILPSAAILEPNRRGLFLTHFGYSDNPRAYLLFRERLHRLGRADCGILRTAASDSARWIPSCPPRYAEISQHLPAGEADHYAFSAGLNLSFLGLARYLRKRATAAP